MREYHTEFKWYAQEKHGNKFGPFDSKELAILGGMKRKLGETYKGKSSGYEFDVFMAKYEPVKLSEWVDIEGEIFNANDYAREVIPPFVNDDRNLFDLSDDDKRILKASVNAAIDKWQNERNLVFNVDEFYKTKNREAVWVPKPEAEK